MTLSNTRSLNLAPVRVNLALRFVVVSICAASAGAHVALVPEHLGESLTLGLALALSAGSLALSALMLRNPRNDSWAPLTAGAVLGLTALLHDHITIAVEVLQAAKTDDTDAFNAANTRWYANGNDIADFLAGANPRSWPDAVMRADMKKHLDQTLAEAAHELHGQYAASVSDYEGIHTHILMMADQLSAGVIAQFPSRFR